MISAGNKKISEIFVGNKRVEEVWVGDKKVFPTELLLYAWRGGSSNIYQIKNNNFIIKTAHSDNYNIWGKNIIGYKYNEITLYDLELVRLKSTDRYMGGQVILVEGDYAVVHNAGTLSVLNKELQDVKHISIRGNYGENGYGRNMFHLGRGILVPTSNNKLFYIPDFLQDTVIDLTSQIAENSSSTRYVLYSKGIMKSYGGWWTFYDKNGNQLHRMQGPNEMEYLYEEGDYLYLGRNEYKIHKINTRTYAKTEIPCQWNPILLNPNGNRSGWNKKIRYMKGGNEEIWKVDITTGSKEIFVRNNLLIGYNIFYV